MATIEVQVAVEVHFRQQLKALGDWNNQPVPPGLRQRIFQEFTVWEMINQQVKVVRNARGQLLRNGTGPWVDKVRWLMGVKAIGVRSVWLFVSERFA